MRKLFLILATIIAGISCSAQDLKWSVLGPEIASETNSSAAAIEESLKSIGLDVKASSEFNTSTNSVNITLDFGTLDIVSFMNQDVLTEFKNSFTDAFLQVYLSDSEDGALTLPELLKIMDDGKGEYRMILKGAGNEKVIRITPEDFKR